MGTERQSSPVAHSDKSSDSGHQEVDEHVKVADDLAKDQAAGMRQGSDRGRKIRQREETNSQTETPTQSGIARGRQSSRSQSRSTPASESIIEEMDADRGEDFEDTLDSQDVALNNPAPDAGSSAPIDSMSTDVDVDITSRSDREEIEEPGQDVDAARLRPRAAALSPPRSPGAATASNREGKTKPVLQLSPRSSEPDDELEHPRKRVRTSLPVGEVPKTSRPLQMVLGTKGAAWSLQVQDEDGSRVGPPKPKTSRSRDAGARSRIRSKLGSYALPGSQIKPVEVDDDDNESGSSKSDGRGVAMEVEELEVNDKTQDVAGETQAGGSDGVDVIIRDADGEASQTASSAPGIEPVAINWRDNTVDEDDASGPVQRDVSEGLTEDVFYPEIIRTPGATLTLRLDLDRLTSTWSRLCSDSTPSSTLPPTSSDSQGFRPTANVSNAADAEGAERELARVIHKEDFASMHILGQFNLGFIITRRMALNDVGQSVDDLFIVDQHAADEKYNFETLQQTTKIESQKLFQPRPLELTAADELVAIENVDILRSNGFDVVIDDEARAGHGERVKLVAQPVSKSTTFTVKGSYSFHVCRKIY